MKISALKKSFIDISPERFFVLSALAVNGLNYLYNLIMGRMLGPEAFADVALIITLLLMLSFIATTFQVVSSKYQIDVSAQEHQALHAFLVRSALGIGLFIMMLLWVSSSWLHETLNTSSPWLFRIFALGVPLYFVLSINRGIHQGKQNFYSLSYTYLFEVIIKLVGSVGLLYFFEFDSAISVSFAVLASLIVAYFPTELKNSWSKLKKPMLSLKWQKQIQHFFLVTILYECVQVVINSSDIFMVKMFFSNMEAGLYASLALVGRFVYFITWMVVMLVLPKVIYAKKNGENTRKVLMPYLSGIIVFTVFICVICYFFSDYIVLGMFGKAFLSMHSLLYLYAIATSLFAISNLMIYFSLSLEKYIPVYWALLLGVIQVLAIGIFHGSLLQVIQIQIIVMAILALTTSYWVFHKTLK